MDDSNGRTLPPLAALFLTHFDDLKGQFVVYYAAVDGLPSDGIEHKTLPSGLHTLKSDLVGFTHGTLDLPGIGLFRSKTVENQGRGRRMGTLGTVLANDASETVFGLRETLESLYDAITADDVDPFKSDQTKEILDKVWTEHRAQSARMIESAGSTRDIVSGKAVLQPSHPISYLPALLVVLGPLIITVYRNALAGRRILIYSPPPLLPIAAFAWCIQAMSIPPSGAPDAEISKCIGNVGLMDLDAMKQRKGGWIATTSDAIYKSHTKTYDLFIDLSTPPTAPASHSRSPAPSSSGYVPLESAIEPITNAPASLYIPNPSTQSETIPITYTFADIPLYRSLLLLQISPPSVTVSTKLGVRGNMWVWAFELLERAWKICRGVCDYALGQAPIGDVHLPEGEEDATMVDVRQGLLDEDNDTEEGSVNGLEEDETIRVGRLLLRQFHHNTYHVFQRLRTVRRGTGGPLKESEIRELVGRSWRFGRLLGSDEGKWWNDLASTWGIAIEED